MIWDNFRIALQAIRANKLRSLLITRGLVSRGYTDEQVRGILGENYLRIFEEVCG